MRRFAIVAEQSDPVTFELIFHIHQDDGVITRLKYIEKYPTVDSSEDREKLYVLDNLLQTNGHPPITVEEINGYLYPFGKPKDPTEDELQRLAGFAVKKEMTSFDDNKKKAE